MVSVFIDKKATLFDQFLLQPLFVSPRIARVLVDRVMTLKNDGSSRSDDGLETSSSEAALVKLKLKPTVVSVFIDKKATLFDQFLLQPLFVSARIARVLVEKQVSQPIRK